MTSLELANLGTEIEKQNYILIELTNAINELTETLKEKGETNETGT